MKKILVMGFLLLAATAHADNSKIEVRGTVDNDSEIQMSTGTIQKYFTSGATQQQTVSLTASAYTAFTPPTGTRALLIDVLTADGIKLKGLTGDQGISLDSTCPVLLPISRDGTTTVGIQNMEPSAQNVKLFWF